MRGRWVCLAESSGWNMILDVRGSVLARVLLARVLGASLARGMPVYLLISYTQVQWTSLCVSRQAFTSDPFQGDQVVYDSHSRFWSLHRGLADVISGGRALLLSWQHIGASCQERSC